MKPKILSNYIHKHIYTVQNWTSTVPVNLSNKLTSSWMRWEKKELLCIEFSTENILVKVERRLKEKSTVLLERICIMFITIHWIHLSLSSAFVHFIQPNNSSSSANPIQRETQNISTFTLSLTQLTSPSRSRHFP